MPYNRPGAGHYAINGATAINHGQPVVRDGIAGVAVKQKARSWSAGFATQKQIDATEPFFIIAKGIVQVPAYGGAVVGDKVNINDTTYVLSTTGGAGTHKFGVVHEVATQRGTPTGFIRVDLDAKDSF